MVTTLVCAVLVSLNQESAEAPPLPRVLTFARCQLSQDGKSVAVTSMGWTNKTQEYNVMIPVTREVVNDDGEREKVVAMQPATRTRVIKAPAKIRRVHPLADCEFRTMKGRRLSADELSDRLSTAKAVLVLSQNEKLDDFYRGVLRESLLVAVIPGLAANRVPAPPAAIRLPAPPAAAPPRALPQSDDGKKGRIQGDRKK